MPNHWGVYVAGAVAGLFLLALSSYAVPVLAQEGDPFAVIFAAARLELSGAALVPLTGDGRKLLQRSGQPQQLTPVLAAQGWRFVDQMGAGIFYERDGIRLLVMSRPLTRRYMVYELSGR